MKQPFYTALLLVNAKPLWGEPEEAPLFAILYTRRRRSSLSVVESECEALVIFKVGAITAEEHIARIQSDQRRGPEHLACHNDRVYCVCAHAQAGSAWNTYISTYRCSRCTSRNCGARSGSPRLAPITGCQSALLGYALDTIWFKALGV